MARRISQQDAVAMLARFRARETTLDRERKRFALAANYQIRRALLELITVAEYRELTKKTPTRRQCSSCGHLKPPNRFHKKYGGNICASCGKRSDSRTAFEHALMDSSPVVEVPTGRHRLVLIQRLGSLVRLTSGTRTHRGDSVRSGGTTCIPIAKLPQIVAAVRRVARTTAK